MENKSEELMTIKNQSENKKSEHFLTTQLNPISVKCSLNGVNNYM